jgi:TolB protein
MKSLLLSLLLAVPVGATDVYIGVQNQQGQRPKLALPHLIPGKAADALLGSKARDTLRGDLMFSRYFEVITDGPPTAGLAEPQIIDAWSKLAAAAVVGTVTDQGGKKSLSLKLVDLNTHQTLLDKHYESADWRSAMHTFADAVVQTLVGRAGIAHTRIAFANDHTGSKEIYVADYDGYNLKRLTSDKSIALLPRWTRDGGEVYYTDYKAANPDLYAISADGGDAREVSTRSGINIAGGFSPDGRFLLVTLANKSATNIYRLTIGDHQMKAITSHWGIDASPTYSPDGQQIAFVSDRAGNPEVHIMETETGRTRRLTDLNWCDSPSWSPQGDWIAFAGRITAKSPLNIYLIDVTGNQLRQVTRDAGNNEDPTWSPDGRYLAFTTTRTGRKEIFVMDADGSAQHKLLEMPGGSYTPNWGP